MSSNTAVVLHAFELFVQFSFFQFIFVWVWLDEWMWLNVCVSGVGATANDSVHVNGWENEHGFRGWMQTVVWIARWQLQKMSMKSLTIVNIDSTITTQLRRQKISEGVQPLEMGVSPWEGGPTLPLRAMPSQPPCMQGPLPGARHRAPTLGLMSRWGKIRGIWYVLILVPHLGPVCHMWHYKADKSPDHSSPSISEDT